MPETNTLAILLYCCFGLLITLFILVLRISGKLNRLESLISQSKSRSASAPAPAEPVSGAPSAAETSPGGAFEAFLAEDSSRRELTKSEQFAAYRQWRQEKGMNWSNS
ncbi:MAG: hypothetical protein EOP88_16710 [Verrucomicrobiaceae bacterium]|nr:MAG: hypothetical protein EOP88_16710 [Verrucomicrobiaceae bacterium]